MLPYDVALSEWGRMRRRPVLDEQGEGQMSLAVSKPWGFRTFVFF